MDVEGGPPPHLSPEFDAFKHLIASCGKRKADPSIQRFVKKEDILIIELPIQRPCRTALILAERGLIGKFTGLRPSPKAIEGWV